MHNPNSDDEGTPQSQYRREYLSPNEYYERFGQDLFGSWKKNIKWLKIGVTTLAMSAVVYTSYKFGEQSARTDLGEHPEVIVPTLSDGQLLTLHNATVTALGEKGYAYSYDAPDNPKHIEEFPIYGSPTHGLVEPMFGKIPKPEKAVISESKK